MKGLRIFMKTDEGEGFLDEDPIPSSYIIIAPNIEKAARISLKQQKIRATKENINEEQENLSDEGKLRDGFILQI